MKYTVSEIARIIDGVPRNVDVSAVVNNIATDSRVVAEGDLFVAIPGEKYDGHDFIGSAYANGAVACVVRRGTVTSLPSIEVADTVVALGMLAKNRILTELKGGVRIAVTGSVGKTTTKELIYSILSVKYRVSRSPKSFNNAIGVPLTVFDTPADSDFIVLEVGTNHAGEIAYLASRVMPHIAVLTRSGYGHIGFLGSTEAIAHEKADLFRILPPDGTAVINLDSLHGDIFMKSVPSGVKTLTYSTKSPEAHIFARPLLHHSQDWKDMLFHTHVEIDGEEFMIPLPISVVENGVAAVAVAKLLGFGHDEIQEGLNGFHGVPMRMEVMDLDGIEIVNDAYNANPDSMLALFRTFEPIARRSKIWFVLGDMLELGEYSEKLHRMVGSEFVKHHLDNLIAVGKDARFIAEEATIAGVRHAFYFPEKEEVVEFLKKVLDIGDIIVLKASRAMEFEKIVEGLRDAISHPLST